MIDDSCQRKIYGILSMSSPKLLVLFFLLHFGTTGKLYAL